MKTASYGEIKSRLDEIVGQLEAGELDIDASAAAYEQAMQLVAQLAAYLKHTENKITKIKQIMLAE